MSKIIGILDHCYRKGVMDAYASRNEGLCREHLAKTSEAGVFGFLDNERPWGWQEWALEIIKLTRYSAWGGIMSKIFSCADRFGTNHLSCVYVLTQAFYNKGIEDYIRWPNGSDITAFQAQNRLYWTANGVKTAKINHWIEDVQSLTLSLEERDALVWENETASYARRHALKRGQYEWFRNRVPIAKLVGKNDRDFTIYD